MNNNETARIIAEAAVKLEEAKDRIVELEKLAEQQRKTIAHLKETIRQGKYIRLSERGRSL